jgi:hypothetical protein
MILIIDALPPKGLGVVNDPCLSLPDSLQITQILDHILGLVQQASRSTSLDIDGSTSTHCSHQPFYDLEEIRSTLVPMYNLLQADRLLCALLG